MKSRIAHCLNNTKAKKIYLDLLGTLKEDDLKPHVFVSKMMEIYHSYVFTLAKKPDRSTHGLYFEYVIGETLAMNGVQHMYYQAVIEHVPLVVFDWFLYHRKYPISISCKTKARDRWKQAAHEGAALKQVYSQSTNFLITLEKVSKADEKKEQAPRTIDHFIVATEEEYTTVIAEITQREYTKAASIPPINNGLLITPN